MEILTVGRAPFRVVELYSENPLLEGDVDYLEDRDHQVNPQLRRELIGLYETCHTLIFEDYPKDLENGIPEQLSYLVAGRLPLDLLWKQQILESRSEADREERLVTYLREWAPHLQKQEDLRRRSAGNGHGLN
jgi:Lon protease-like protein